MLNQILVTSQTLAWLVGFANSTWCAALWALSLSHYRTYWNHDWCDLSDLQKNLPPSRKWRSWYLCLCPVLKRRSTIPIRHIIRPMIMLHLRHHRPSTTRKEEWSFKVFRKCLDTAYSMLLVHISRLTHSWYSYVLLEGAVKTAGPIGSTSPSVL